MNSHEHMLVVKALANMTKEMSKLQFSALGSLYFADTPVDKSNLIQVSDGFCIGPHCGKRYWPRTPGPLESPPGTTELKGTVEEHLDLARTAEQVLQRLALSDAIRNVERPMLLHRDLHKRNIFVSDDDPAKITSIIDWQSSSIEPVHHYSDETPDLCDFPERLG